MFGINLILPSIKEGPGASLGESVTIDQILFFFSFYLCPSLLLYIDYGLFFRLPHCLTQLGSAFLLFHLPLPPHTIVRVLGTA